MANTLFMKRLLIVLAFIFGLLGNTFAQKELNNHISVYCSYPFQLTKHNSIEKWRSNGQYDLAFSKRAIDKFYIGLECGISIFDIFYKYGILHSCLNNNPDMLLYDLKITFQNEFSISSKCKFVPIYNFGVTRIIILPGDHTFGTYANKMSSVIGLDFKRKLFEKLDLGLLFRYQMVFQAFNNYTKNWYFPVNITNEGDKYFKSIAIGINIGYNFKNILYSKLQRNCSILDNKGKKDYICVVNVACV